MKQDLQSKLSFFLLGTFLLVLPGCISQKKLDRFRQEHADKTVFEYTYNNKTYLAAAEVSFWMIDEAATGGEGNELKEETASVDLGNYETPALKVRISPLVFLKKKHQQNIRLVLAADKIIATKGLQTTKVADLSIIDEPKELLFQIDKEQVSKREALKINLQLIDEGGSLLAIDALSFKRAIDFILIAPEVRTEEPCLTKRFTIQLVSLERDSIKEGLVENQETGAQFPADEEGKVYLDICEDLLPVTYPFLVGAAEHRPELVRIQFEASRSVYKVELDLNPSSNINEGVDTDGDGVEDDRDNCPGIPGPASNGGCPVDYDKDGLTGSEDKCPYNPGPRSNDGCPLITQPERGGETKEMPDDLIEDTFWEVIKTSDVPSDFENYLDEYPDGKYVQQAQKRLQDSYTKIARGLMSILIPDTMELNIPEVVTVMISGDTSLAARERVVDEFIDQQDLPPEDIPKVRDELIKITEIMRAELRDPSPPNNRNFFIDPPGQREQKVDLYGEDPTIWNWTVTPLKKGEHQLNVIVYIIFDQNGKEVPKEELQIFKIDIIVKQTFLEKNWAWLLGGGLAILGLLLWLFLFRKKEKQKERLQLQLPHQQIMGLIGEGELKDALEKLETALDGVSDKYHQQVILFKSRLAENEENINQGVVDTKDATLEQTRITKGVLALMGKLKEEFEITSSTPNHRT
jgi:LPXTG-motif cell wall-anchored protein